MTEIIFQAMFTSPVDLSSSRVASIPRGVLSDAPDQELSRKLSITKFTPMLSQQLGICTIAQFSDFNGRIRVKKQVGVFIR